MQVWVCGLPHEYSEEQVREYWQYCGPVEALDLLTFKDSGRCAAGRACAEARSLCSRHRRRYGSAGHGVRAATKGEVASGCAPCDTHVPGPALSLRRFNGAAFVTFRTQEAYETALAANGEELEGRKLRVRASQGGGRMQGCVLELPPLTRYLSPFSVAQVEKCKVAVPKRGAAAQRAAAAASPVAAPPAQPAAAPAAAPAQPPTQQQQQQPAAEQGVAADGSYNVAYVGNVAFEASEADLHKLFTPLGAQQVRLLVDAKSGRHKGFAHVHFADAASLAK